MGFSPPQARQTETRADRNPRRSAAQSGGRAVPRIANLGRLRGRDDALGSAVASSLRGLARVRFDRLLDGTVYLGFFALLLLSAPGLDYFLVSQDHGYQLSIGSQILLGKVPGIDIITAYGPAAMYTSALGLWASGSLVGEAVLCAGGYALALFLIYQLVSAHASRLEGLAAAASAFALLARFYKWYVWLIPLLTLWALNRYLSRLARPRQGWVGGCGLVLGLCWLYRLDLGTMELAVSVLVVALAELRWVPGYGSRFEKLTGALSSVVLLIGTFSILPLLWLGYLAIHVGSRAPQEFFATTLAGALAVAKGMAQAIPANDEVVRGYLVAPLTLVTAAGVALYRELYAGGDRRSRFLLTAALVGLAAAHQAMHRRGPAHLLQVFPPVSICAFVSLAEFRRWIAGASLRRATTWAACLAGIAYFSFLAIGANGLAQWARQDLVTLSFSLSQRYWDLAHPLSSAGHRRGLKAIEFIRQETGHRDSILVFPLDCQLYALAERRLSGRLHAYYAGVFDDPRSQQENLAAIRREMPAVVVLPSGRKTRPSDDPLAVLAQRSRESHRYVEEFVRAEYTRVAYDDGEFVVLARGG